MSGFILVVENDEGLKDLIVSTLTAAGYEAAGCSCASDALKQVTALQPGALLIEQKLPDMTARELVAALDSQGIKIPFIVTAGFEDERQAVEMMKLGAADYLVRNTDFPAILPVAVERLFSAAEKEQALRAAEEKLRESGELYRKMLATVPDIIIRTDLQGNITFINNFAFSSMSVEPQETIYGRNMLSFIAEKDLPRALENTKLMFEHPLGPKEYQLRFDNSSLIEAEVNGDVIYDSENNPIGMVYVIRDITERKKAEENLRQLAQAIEQSSSIVVITDLEGCISYANSRFEETTGYTVAEAIGQNPRILKTGKTTPEEYKELWKNISSGIEWRGEFQNRRKDGTLYWEAASISPVFDLKGEITHYLAVKEDITELMHTEEELEKTRALLEQTSRVARIGGWETDLTIGKAVWSAVKKEIHEVPDNFIPAIDDTINFYKEGKDRSTISEMVKQAVETGRPYDVEARIVTPKGRTLWVRTIGYADFKDGRCVRLYGTTQDIDNLKKAEEEKLKLQTQLIQAAKMESVGRLAGGVAHDFNNMLMVILGHAEMALEQSAPGQQIRADIEEIHKAARRSADLTRQLLAFARKQPVAPRVLDLNKTIEGMITMLKRLIGEDIGLIWKPGKELRSVRIDPSQLDQILANLCINARDAVTDSGKIIIGTETAVIDREYCDKNEGFIPGEYVMLYVSDNGCGMDSETLSHLFEPFYTTKEMGRGTGLGLATIYGAVKQNNGFINVYSEPEKGTTVKIFLPGQTVIPSHENYEDNAGRKAGDNARGSETILLVEDEPAILDMTGLILKRLGYTVLTAGTPDEALSLAGKHSGSVDLLMTDVIMPGMNGRELADKLLLIYPDIKLLFMSGYTADVIAHQGVLDAGVHFLQKPFPVKDLAAKLRESLNS